MNLFYLARDTELCAQLHYDKHVVKMIVETAQLLSTAHRVLDGEMYRELSPKGRRLKRWKHSRPHFEDLLYKATHMNHPSAVWCRSSVSAYMWTARLLKQLCKEYTHRYKKVHKVERTQLMQLLHCIPAGVPSFVDFVAPPQCMPDSYADADCIVAYRNYYVGDKLRMARYTNRTMPLWVAAALEEEDE